VNGDINLLAVVHNTGCELGVGGVSAMSHFYGHDNVSVGAWKGQFGSDCTTHLNDASGQDQYLSKIIDNPAMRGPVTSSKEAALAVDVYRQVLAAAPNSSVNIASIGMTTNLRDLLASHPDQFSPLHGYSLIAAKVAKIVWMDGMYNFGCAAGYIGPAEDCCGSAQAALKMPPSVRLVFSGKGENPDIYSGAGLQTHHPQNSPCREAMKDWCCNRNSEGGVDGRLSWDPITVMIASLDVGAVYEKEVNYGTQVSADPDGHEHFFGNGTKNAQTDFAQDNAPALIPAAIDNRINQAPPTPAPAPGWTRNAGYNCYGSRNGQPAHGAKDLENPAWASAGPPMTISQCQMLCRDEQGCTAITMQLHADADGLYDCYQKADIDLPQCDHGTGFDTWTADAK
jgi:hypothetical protein